MAISLFKKLISSTPYVEKYYIEEYLDENYIESLEIKEITCHQWEMASWCMSSNKFKMNTIKQSMKELKRQNKKMRAIIRNSCGGEGYLENLSD